MAMIALQRNEPTRALALFKKALAVSPSNVAIRMNLGALYLTYRQVNAAAIQFERVLKDQPENLDAKFHLAIARTALGKPEFAAQVYDEVLDQKSDHPLALFNSALLEADRGDYKLASARLKEYLKTDHAKISNNKEVFALIEEIERGESAKGLPKSDEEIQKLAAKAVASKDDSQEPTPQKAAETKVEKPSVAAAPAPEVKKPSAIPQQKAPVNVDADIDMLQKELAK
jgi:tetratricopeptide (TPR) repeat protein